MLPHHTTSWSWQSRLPSPYATYLRSCRNFVSLLSLRKQVSIATIAYLQLFLHGFQSASQFVHRQGLCLVVTRLPFLSNWPFQNQIRINCTSLSIYLFGIINQLVPKVNELNCMHFNGFLFSFMVAISLSIHSYRRLNINKFINILVITLHMDASKQLSSNQQNRISSYLPESSRKQFQIGTRTPQHKLALTNTFQPQLERLLHIRNNGNLIPSPNNNANIMFSQKKHENQLIKRSKTYCINELDPTLDHINTHTNCRKNVKYKFLELVQDGQVVPQHPRVSRYRNTSNQHAERWAKSVEVYMESRNRISNFFNRQAREQRENLMDIGLDKMNSMMINKKLTELKTKSPNQSVCTSEQKKGFVSHLIAQRNTKRIKQRHDTEPIQIQEEEKDSSVGRDEAILVNFVSTYFRRKFYKKKNKNSLNTRRFKNHQRSETQMIALEGKTIQDCIINKMNPQRAGVSP